MERTAKKKQLRMKRSKNEKEVTPEKAYLAVYNSVQFGGWAYLFFLIIGPWLEYALEPQTAAAEAWDTVRTTLLIFQCAQLLENMPIYLIFYGQIGHAALGLVSSSILNTSIQTLMKLFIVIICQLVPAARESYAFSSLIFAWSAGEFFRYLYFAMISPLVVGRQTPDIVPFLRYSAFIVLYPIGFLSEFIILYIAFQTARASEAYSFATLPLIVILVAYWPVAAYMYKSMFKQRAKHLGAQAEEDKDE